MGRGPRESGIVLEIDEGKFGVGGVDQRKQVRRDEGGERRKLPARGQGGWGGNRIGGSSRDNSLMAGWLLIAKSKMWTTLGGESHIFMTLMWRRSPKHKL